MSTTISEVFTPPLEDFEPQELIDVPTTKERLDAIESQLGIRKSWWTKAGEHKVVAGLIVAVIVGACALITNAFHSQINEYVDGRIKSQTDPLASELTTIDERTSRIEGELKILHGELIAQKYSSVPLKDLKLHRDELKQVKTTLAELPLKTSPAYWTVSFQIITLFSRATFDVEKISEQRESVIDNMMSNRAGVLELDNKRVVLRNLVQGVIIKNSIVRFEPSVRLSNDTFINCVFLFPVMETPSRPLQEIGRELLASDLSKVTLNAS